MANGTTPTQPTQGAQPKAGGQDKSAFSTLGGAAGDIIKGLGLVAASAAIPGFGEAYVAGEQRSRAEYFQGRQNLLDDLQKAPRMALNPGIQKDIKRFFGDDALQQFVNEANRVSVAEAFIQGVMGGAAETQFQSEAAGGGAPAPQAATPIPAATPAPTAAPVASAAPTRRRRTPATALQERLEPGQSVTVRHNGISVNVTAPTPEERAAAEWDNLLNEIVDADPRLLSQPERAIELASRAAVGRINFSGLPDEVKTILTTGTIEEKRQWAQTQYERIRAKQQAIGEREGRLEQPLTTDELVGGVVQEELETINAVLQARGLPPLNDQEAAGIRLDRSRNIQRDIAAEKARATTRATQTAPLGAVPKETENIRPLSPKDSEFFSGATVQMQGWAEALGYMESQAQKFGPISGQFHNLAEAYGFESPEYTTTKTMLGRMVEQATRLMQGARATDEDRKQMVKLFPKPTDPPPVIVGNTVAALNETLRWVRARESQLNSEGFRVPKVEVPEEIQFFLDRHTPAQSLDEVRKTIKRAK